MMAFFHGESQKMRTGFILVNLFVGNFNVFSLILTHALFYESNFKKGNLKQNLNEKNSV